MSNSDRDYADRRLPNRDAVDKAMAWDAIAKKNAKIEQLRTALQAAREKLEIYRAGSDGVYQGGMEYRMLKNLINEALKD